MAALLMFAAGASATATTETIPFTGIPLLEKTEEFEIDHTMTASGFLTSIQADGTITARTGAPWWNDFAVGVMYPAGACTLSYGGFTSTLRYPNYQGTLGIWKGSMSGGLPVTKSSGPAPVTSNFYLNAGTTVTIGFRNGYGLSGTHSVTFDPATTLILTIDDSDAGGPTGNGEKCTAGIYMDGIAPSPPPTVAPGATPGPVAAAPVVAASSPDDVYCNVFRNGMSSADVGSKTCWHWEYEAQIGNRIVCEPVGPDTTGGASPLGSCRSDYKRGTARFLNKIYPLCTCDSYKNDALAKKDTYASAKTGRMCMKTFATPAPGHIECYDILTAFDPTKGDDYNYYGCPVDMQACYFSAPPPPPARRD